MKFYLVDTHAWFIATSEGRYVANFHMVRDTRWRVGFRDVRRKEFQYFILSSKENTSGALRVVPCLLKYNRLETICDAFVSRATPASKWSHAMLLHKRGTRNLMWWAKPLPWRRPWGISLSSMVCKVRGLQAAGDGHGTGGTLSNSCNVHSSWKVRQLVIILPWRTLKGKTSCTDPFPCQRCRKGRAYVWRWRQPVGQGQGKSWWSTRVICNAIHLRLLLTLRQQGNAFWYLQSEGLEWLFARTTKRGIERVQ